MLSIKSPNFDTLVDLLRYRAFSAPDKVAFAFLKDGETQTNSLTYQQLDRQARAIAQALTCQFATQLQSQNVIGERALLIYPPGLEFITAFFGCLYAGVVAVPAYPPRNNQSMTRQQAIVTDSQATVALTTTVLWTNIESQIAQNPQLAALRWLTTDNITESLASEWQQPILNSNTLAFVQYTSGSTGTPKGVMVSHGNLIHNSALINHCFQDTSDSLGVSWLPPYHDMGLIGGILQPIYVGASMILMPPMAFLQQPFRWLEVISRYKVTTSGGPNFAYDLCIRKITPEQRASLDLSRWEVAFTGAEPVRAHTLESFAQTFEISNFRKQAFLPCYGMAETTLIVSGGLKTDLPLIQQVNGSALEENRVVTDSVNQENTRTLVGCGQSLLDQKVIIANPQSLTQCQPEEVGEIWVSGPSIAQGYWNQELETEKTFNAYLADTQEGPFLRTGDLGFLRNGELFVTGRLKNVIIIRGRNHYPQDIEQVVQKSHPALRANSGAAFAVDIKGEDRLVIVQEVERSYLRKLNVREVVGDIRQAVAAQHDLQVYAVALIKTGSIPITSSGKIQHYACRLKFLNGTLDLVEDWSENPQSKAKFLHLQTEVESILQQLQTSKQQ